MRESATIDGPTLQQHRQRQGREFKRNSWLLVANGATMFAGFTFASSELVLPAFVQTLTTSSILVGLTGALMRMGWSFPQVFVGRIVEPLPRKMPVFRVVGTLQFLFWLAIGAVTLLLGVSRPGLLLVSFLVLYALAAACMGVASVPRMDIMGKAIPSRDRARVFARRRLGGGGVAMVAGVSIGYILSDASGLIFPANYGVLFLLAGISIGFSVLSFSMIREPIEQSTRGEQLSLRDYIRRGVGVIKEDRNYRRLCAVQFFWGFGSMGAPFYVPYAMTDLKMGAEFVGFFATVMQLSSIFSNVLWAWVGQRKGNHALLSIGSYVLGLAVLVPLTVTLIPSKMVDPTAALGFSYPFDLRVGYFALTFVFSGCAWSGMFTGRMTYILDIAPPDRRPTYTSFMNAFMIPEGILPILSGALVALISYRNVFLIAAAFVPLAILMSRKLEAVKVEDEDA
jgi:MFS family permease